LDYRKFLTWLNNEYGPIASFYWGARYAIVVSDIGLVQELKRFYDKQLRVSRFAVGSILLGDQYFWHEENFREYLYMGYGYLQDKYEDHGIKIMLEESFQNQIFMEYPNSKNLLAIHKNEIANTTSKSSKYPANSIYESWSRPLIVVFKEEIDLDAHPVPAYIPIIINMELLLKHVDESEIEPLLRTYFSWLFTPDPKTQTCYF